MDDTINKTYDTNGETMAKKRRLKKPQRVTLFIIFGAVIIGLAYAWARYTFENDVANGGANMFAGILGVAGLALVILAPLYELIRKHFGKTKK